MMASCIVRIPGSVYTTRGSAHLGCAKRPFVKNFTAVSMMGMPGVADHLSEYFINKPESVRLRRLSPTKIH